MIFGKNLIGGANLHNLYSFNRFRDQLLRRIEEASLENISIKEFTQHKLNLSEISVISLMIKDYSLNDVVLAWKCLQCDELIVQFPSTYHDGKNCIHQLLIFLELVLSSGLYLQVSIDQSFENTDEEKRPTYPSINIHKIFAQLFNKIDDVHKIQYHFLVLLVQHFINNSVQSWQDFNNMIRYLETIMDIFVSYSVKGRCGFF